MRARGRQPVRRRRPCGSDDILAHPRSRPAAIRGPVRRPTALTRPQTATPLRGPIAQRLEQRTHNPLVPGSNPGGPTKIQASQPRSHRLLLDAFTNAPRAGLRRASEAGSQEPVVPGKGGHGADRPSWPSAPIGEPLRIAFRVQRRSPGKRQASVIEVAGEILRIPAAGGAAPLGQGDAEVPISGIHALGAVDVALLGPARQIPAIGLGRVFAEPKHVGVLWEVRVGRGGARSGLQGGIVASVASSDGQAQALHVVPAFPWLSWTRKERKSRLGAVRCRVVRAEPCAQDDYPKLPRCDWMAHHTMA